VNDAANNKDEDEMAVSVEMRTTGDPALRAEVVTAIEHVLSQGF
jgi:hypothetical protein